MRAAKRGPHSQSKHPYLHPGGRHRSNFLAKARTIVMGCVTKTEINHCTLRFELGGNFGFFDSTVT